MQGNSGKLALWLNYQPEGPSYAELLNTSSWPPHYQSTGLIIPALSPKTTLPWPMNRMQGSLVL